MGRGDRQFARTTSVKQPDSELGEPEGLAKRSTTSLRFWLDKGVMARMDVINPDF